MAIKGKVALKSNKPPLDSVLAACKANKNREFVIVFIFF
jgi:hypothetical protein